MKIVCKNSSGQELSMGWFPPLWIASIDGLGIEYNIYTSKNSGQDGENYNGSDAKMRNIVISLDVAKSDYLEHRNRLYSFFQPRSKGTLYYYDGDEARKIEYYAEKITPDCDENSPIRTLTISLICPDPKFYDIDDKLTQLATWKGKIKWPLRLNNPFVVTTKENTLIGNIYNSSAVPMGLTIKFFASGTVSNPSLYDVNRHELMKINTAMSAGDLITVTTADGNKRVTLTRGGVTTNINNLMAYPPRWLKAYQGDNLFRYNADEGIDYLSVSILTRQAYWGA